MCARFSLFTGSPQIATLFGLEEPIEWEPSPNIAPTEDAPVIFLDREGHRSFRQMRWGLVPHWADSPSGPPLINARSEGIEKKPAFRDPFARHRCLIPADGFFEWHSEGRSKQPYFIFRADRRPMALAGIWDRWRNGDQVLRSCAVITTDANAKVAKLHDRMPVLIEPLDFDLWLDPETPAEQLAKLLVPADDEMIELYPVTTRMGNPRYKERDAIEPEPGEGEDGQLSLL